MFSHLCLLLSLIFTTKASNVFFLVQQNRTSALESNGFFRPCNSQLSPWFSMRIPKLVPLIAKGRKKNTLALDVIVKKLTTINTRPLY